MLNELPKEILIELLFSHLRSMWSVDGLYFIGIEERFGTAAATEIDAWVWKVMGKLEARRLRKTVDISGNDLSSVIRLLRHSGWALDLEFKEIEEYGDRAIVRNRDCRVQRTRLKKGLGEFPCKTVRWGFLKEFVKECNPALTVRCNVCPPDAHSDTLWCEWVIQ
jgi:hypothetical protein